MKVFRLCSIALLLLLGTGAISGCGVYSFSGATIEGKNIRLTTLENRARNVVPTLAPILTDKLRNRIVSQTGLAPVNIPEPDYDITGFITTYELTVTGVQGGNSQQATQNRLTIGIEITFKNRLDPKANFKQTFTRFADFAADKSLQAVEAQLIDDIGTQLADDVFNKAFVNW
jgi:hypothetical protein